MNTKKYFTIGQMSKQTGVNFNSLRYYEKIGILQPAYVDPQSGYRYYAFSQIHIVEAISLCVDLGIPLNSFSDFFEEDTQNVNITKIIEQGKIIAREKMQMIEHKLQFLEKLQSAIEHTENSYNNANPQRSYFSEKMIWLVPYEGVQNSDEYNIIFKKTIADINSYGLKVGYDYGLIMFSGTEGDKTYFYVDLEITSKQAESYENVYCLPAGNYLSMTKRESDIKAASNMFGMLFNMSSDRIVIETEVFTKKLSFQSPRYEIRCLIPEYKK